MSVDEWYEPIAVIGMAGRFPGARNVAELWQNLLDGVNSIQFFEEEELRAAGVHEEELRNPNYVKAAPVIDDAEWLDAAFFGISPREAEALDPQQRVLLEVSHTALQNAGHVPDTFDGRIGIYAGSRNSDYLERNVHANRRFMEAVGGVTAVVSNHVDYVATGVAYRLNLRGPAVSTVTACSTSLVAVHLAVGALRGGECEMALAGGVEIPIPTPHGYVYNEGGFTSPDGHIRPFDANARGTVFGAGAGVVVLRRLSDAVRNGDPIHAVILGSAINNDGAAKSAFTAPTEEGQVAVIDAALRQSRVAPATVGFVEAHGTATIIGDPIEVSALSRVYGRDSGEAGTRALASVKGNVGHLGAAAGVCGLIKAIHCVREGVLTPSIGFDEPNPRIPFESSPFSVVRELTKWEPAGPRRAGVSAFGVGGTNAHVIIEQPPEPEPTAPPRRPYQLFALSARTPEALDAVATQLGEQLASESCEPADVAYTLNVGRAELAARRIVVAPSPGLAAARLTGEEAKPATTVVPRGVTREVAFLFPGQGAQHPGMARDLYTTEPTFAAHIDRFAGILTESHDLDLLNLLYPDPGDDEEAALRLARTEAAQPALFAVEYAFAMLLAEWGVEPAVMVGHSVGEYVAACLAGVMSSEDAMRLVAARGALVQSLPTGSMLAVMLPEEPLRAMLPDELEIAAVNSPDVCVISGPDEEIRQMRQTLTVQGVAVQPLHTSHAFHSRVLDPILDTFGEMVAQVPLSAPQKPYMSNVTGAPVTADDVTDPGYWVRQLRGAVRFSDSLEPLVREGRHVFLEVGPGASLSGLVRAHASPGGSSAPTAVPAMRRSQDDRDDVEVALEAVGRVWAAGAAIDWDHFWGEERRRRVSLPAYPYERKRFWVEPQADERQEPVAEDRGPFYVPTWRETAISADPPPTSLSTQDLWVVFHQPDSRPLRSLVERLRAAGGNVLTVEPGEEFVRGEGGRYAIRVSEDDDYVTLVEDIVAVQAERVRVVHAWDVGKRAEAAEHASRQRLHLDHGFLSVLALVQATSRVLGELAMDLCIVTSDMQDVTGDGNVEPAKSTVLGLVRVMPKEFEDIVSRSVDITLDPPAGQLAEQLFTEITSDTTDKLVAYRGRKRWIWSYTSVPVQDTGKIPPSLKRRGVYLITGGLGGLGLAVARHLGGLLDARLVLVGRTGLPDRSEWPALLADRGTDERLARRIRGVLDVEEGGGEVLVCAADASDEVRMRQVRADAERVFGPVDGVFHLAGLEGGALIETRTRDDVEAVFRPKGTAPYVLDRVFEPGLLVLYSSIAAITGELGQGDYAGANAVMDAYAQVQWASGRNVVSINWPPWTEVGMARESNGPALLTDLGLGMETTACSDHPLLGNRREQRHGARDYVAFEIDMTPTTWVLDEHRLTDTPVNRKSGPTVPATGIIELACAAYREVTGSATAEIRDLTFLRPLTAEPGLEVRAELIRTGDGTFDFRLTGRLPDGPPTEYARGRLGPAGIATPQYRDLSVVRQACPDETGDLCHHPIAVDVGPRWDSIAGRMSGVGLDLVTLQLPDELADDVDDFLVHPATLDNATALGMRLPEGKAYLPLSYDRFTLLKPLPARFHSIIRYVDGEVDPERELVRADVTLVDDGGSVLVEIEGLTLLKMDPERLEASTAPPAAGLGGGASEIRDLETTDLSFDITFVYGREDNRDSGVSTEDAGKALLAILARPSLGPQVILCPGGLEERARRVGRITRMALTRALTERSVTPMGGVVGRSLDTPYEPPETDTERSLAQLWQDAFGLDEVGVTDDFQELGGNSLLAVQLVARLSGRLDVNVSVAQLFEARNIRRLAATIDQNAAPITVPAQ